MLAASTRLGPYEILAPLGAGGMGEVYRARDTRLGREVAVKVLPEPLANDPSRRARFAREAQVVAALSHPGIVALHDCGDEGGVAYAVTELLRGETLRARLARGPLPWRKAVEVAAAVAEALAAAHAKGIVHRDLKPENLFLTDDGRVKVLDFGLAQVRPPEDARTATVTWFPVDTGPGLVMGTVGYMAPEQVRGQPADARSDLFALGCVLHEMVTGRRAFARETAAETLTAILHDEPEAPADVSRPPPEVEQRIRHCLEKNPEERFQSARDLTFSLRTLLSDPGPAAAPSPAKGRAAPGRRRRARSIAVLPLANAGPGPEAEYLSDGITDAVIHTLSRLPKLRVMARSTVFRFKGSAAGPQDIGRELGVDAVVTGRVAAAGDRLTVAVELVDAADGALLWDEHYRRPLADILAVEEEISTSITENLRLRLTGEEKKPLRQQYTTDPEAHRLYLKGRFCWNQRTEAGFDRAVGYFEEALKRDPRYALAYTGLADAHLLLGSAAFELRPPRETMPRAKRAALKALKIDETLAEAHTARAQVARLYEWDWGEAERGFRRALELNPAYATAHHWYALHRANTGRLAEAVTAMRRAQELDPLSLAIGADVGWCLYFARRYDEAVEEYRKTLEMGPNFSWAVFLLGLTYVQQGRYPAAVELFQRALGLSAGNTKVLAALGHAYALSGRKAEALQLLGQLQELARKKHVSPYVLALVHAGLGEHDRALECLRQAYRERAGHLVYLEVDPELDVLRGHPRFAALVRRMKFPAQGG